MSVKLFLAAAAAAFCLGTGIGAAQAETASAASPLNIRQSPGGPVIGVLHRGEEVEVDRCSGGWCFVTHSGPDGWVSQAYLSFEAEDDFEDEDDFGDDEDFEEEEEIAEVCFYDKANFGGQSFCVEGEETNRRLTGYWNNRISSIEITGELTVDLCSEKNLYGACATISSSRSSLPGTLNNKATSYEIY